MEAAGATTPVPSPPAVAAPVGTYRLQLGPDLGFDDAAALVPYLAALGVSHVYLSPILQAAPGSTHGYDVVDHARLSLDLGGEDAYRRLCAALRSAGLGQVVDVVPNHMAAVPENRWWWDVLENGPAGVEAHTFDVDWDADTGGPDPRSRPVLVPVLGDHYGRIVDRGELQLQRRGGRFEVHYHEHRFPVAPRTLDTILRAAAARLAEDGVGRDRLAFFADAFGALPGSWRTEPAAVARRHRDKEVLADLLADLLADDPSLAEAVDAELRSVAADPGALDALLDRQNYRLAHWQAGAYELDYRRFFDITTLVGLRMDRLETFERTHALLLALVAQGCIDGLRIDHPDGLRDPAQYFERLAARAPGRWIVAEKILAAGEPLPPWPIAGTTGYDFAAVAGGLLLDPAGEAPLTDLHRELVGDERSWPQHEDAAKRDVLGRMLAADLSRLVALFLQVCDAERAWRDYPTELLRRGLEEALVSMPVYRTYVRPAPAGEPVASARDEALIRGSLAAAAGRDPSLPGELFEFLGDVLLLRRGGAAGAELSARFQQLTAPVMAKGIEDTAGYRYARLGPLSEVGADPGRFAVSVEELHAHNAHIARCWPATMLATSTHDTKRSEDVRARLSLLSERAEEWAATVWRWRRRDVPYRSDLVDGWAEKFLYEALVGAHPLPVERASVVLAKAVREAKLATSWLDPDPDYEAAVDAFVRGCIEDDAFRAELAAFVEPMVLPGRLASIALVVLRTASPGVGDLYQGTEVWDDSLVDPDNRRPVDFARRRALLEELDRLAPPDAPVHDAALDLADDRGIAKLHVVRASLAARRRFPDAFGAAGTYLPLPAEGPAAAHAVAFARGGDVVAIVPRLTWRLTRPGGGWAGTTVAVPGGRWRNAYTGERFEGDVAPLDAVLGRCGVALLLREPR